MCLPTSSSTPTNEHSYHKVSLKLSNVPSTNVSVPPAKKNTEHFQHRHDHKHHKSGHSSSSSHSQNNEDKNHHKSKEGSNNSVKPKEHKHGHHHQDSRSSSTSSSKHKHHHKTHSTENKQHSHRAKHLDSVSSTQKIKLNDKLNYSTESSSSGLSKLETALSNGTIPIKSLKSATVGDAVSIIGKSGSVIPPSNNSSPSKSKSTSSSSSKMVSGKSSNSTQISHSSTNKVSSSLNSSVSSKTGTSSKPVQLTAEHSKASKESHLKSSRSHEVDSKCSSNSHKSSSKCLKSLNEPKQVESVNKSHKKTSVKEENCGELTVYSKTLPGVPANISIEKSDSSRNCSASLKIKHSKVASDKVDSSSSNHIVICSPKKHGEKRNADEHSSSPAKRIKTEHEANALSSKKLEHSANAETLKSFIPRKESHQNKSAAFVFRNLYDTHSAVFVTPNSKFGQYMHIETHPNGGASVVHSYLEELQHLSAKELNEFAQEYFRIVFSEDFSGAANHVMGIIHGGASHLPDVLDYFSQNQQNLIVKIGCINRQDIETMTVAQYNEAVRKTYCAGTFRTGPLLQMSLVGARQEEVGGYFPDFLDILEQSPFLRLVMPWGDLSLIAGYERHLSNDGPILWVRPGEQMIPTVDLPKSPMKKKR